jgi:hypothetical protein
MPRTVSSGSGAAPILPNAPFKAAAMSGRLSTSVPSRSKTMKLRFMFIYNL